MLNIYKESSHFNSEILKKEVEICKKITESKEFNDLLSFYERQFQNLDVDNYNIILGDYFFGFCQRLTDRFSKDLEKVCDNIDFKEQFAHSVIDRTIPISREKIELLGKNLSKEEKLQIAVHDVLWAAKIYSEMIVLKKLSQFDLVVKNII